MKLGVTGSSGNVGSRVVHLALKNGHSVVGIDKATPNSDILPSHSGQFSFRQTDLTDYSATIAALHGCEAIIHIAGIPHPRDHPVNAHNV